MLNLLLNVPGDIKAKIAEFSQNDEILVGKIELVILFGDELIKVKSQVEAIGGIFENLGFGYGIITIGIEDIPKISTIQEIQYIELPKTLFTSDLGSNRASCVPEVWSLYNLTGEGVLVGFIDSGIDYLHPAFKNEEGGTRIEYIYDLSQGGKVWNKNDINRAINSTDPYSVVSQRDIIGHGTHVAGIACAGGNINKTYYGVAYKSSIAMVKMTGSGKVSYAKSTQLMRGIKFLIQKSKELKQPLVISLSFSTNDGAHNGNSLLEQYIQTICNLERISFVIASGNEGAAAHHAGGVLRENVNLSMAMAADEKSLILQFYKEFLTDVSIEINNPAGASSGIIALKNGIYYQGSVGRDKYFIYNSGPKPFDINGEIIISLNVETGFLTAGTWNINIYSKGETIGGFDIWMPISEGLNPNTKFLKPDPFNTLGIPATVSNVISVGSYNYKTNSLSSFSGRGKTGGDKPDVMAPGEEIVSSTTGGGYDSLSGTSMAAPHAAGAAALFMQWGLVLGNDPYMYGDRLKYFMLKGAKRGRIDTIYPDATWGYGELCLRGGMELAVQRGARSKGLRQECSELFYEENYSNYIVEYEGDIKSAFTNIDYACGFILDDRYAVVSVDINKADEFFEKTKEIVFVEEPSIYTLNQVSPIDAANISQFHESPVLSLTGQGVLVGIIDTGIDYLNEEFMYENDTTKIVSIWDQTIKGKGVPEIVGVGTEYTREEINKAIMAKKQGEDPYTIVNSKDENGHGTSMAGIIGARGKNPELKGAAPGCEFVVVKMQEAKDSTLLREGISDVDIPTYDTAEVILGIKYIYNMARRLNKPLVIYIPLGTNKGAHDGSAIVERYIDEISKVRGVIVVTGCGNEADGEIHASGNFEKSGEEKIIELQVDPLQRDLTFEIWCNKPDKVSVGVISPGGEVIGKIPAKLGEKEISKLVFEGSIITIAYFFPEEITGDEVIRIDIRNARGGIWKFTLYGDIVVNGRYDAWLYQRELIKAGTKFLAPSQNVTLTIPSTSEKAISCAYYDQNTETIVAASGRGFTREHTLKPELAAGGINALTVSRGGGATKVSGSSVGAAVTAGAVALILEWGIVKGNDPTLYSTKVKTYLIRGTKKRTGDVYPNRSWGYGLLDLKGIFEKIR